MREKSSDPNVKELQLLQLVKLYRLLFVEAALVLSDASDIGEAATLLKSLSKQDLLEEHSGKSGLAKNVPYYTLSIKGASKVGVGRERASITGAASISNHLAVLWCSAFGGEGVVRKRVSNHEIGEALGATLHHNNVHFAEKHGERTVIYRAYCTRTSLSNIQSWCLDTLRGLPASYKGAVNQGDYAIAVLAESQASVEKIRQYLERAYKKNVRLNNRVRLIVELAPSTASFPTEYERRFGG